MLKAFSAARRLLDASAAAGRAPSPSAGRAAQLRADTAALFRLLPRRPGGREEPSASKGLIPPASTDGDPSPAIPSAPAADTDGARPTMDVPFEVQAAAVRAHLLAQATHLLAAVDAASAPSDAHPTAQLLPLPPRPPPPAPWTRRTRRRRPRMGTKRKRPPACGPSSGGPWPNGQAPCRRRRRRGGRRPRRGAGGTRGSASSSRGPCARGTWSPGIRAWRTAWGT
ncbi:hypothetical protein BU14_0014s0044 [Porphyra umbilicalis]|uniref:Uncharacterized protein n=1 Tax=Porphyra umbilicalis TaxID=2786 RepID=A0A1X6PKQ9_PORUM|nr:hypothetical protein BU14_0014s0044 [Porphyra umbilicalis]|eukprot:OSX81494.1 hypothetical protein BU14_0014s0044 [Porphyra umbilicalis]